MLIALVISVLINIILSIVLIKKSVEYEKEINFFIKYHH